MWTRALEAAEERTVVHLANTNTMRGIRTHKTTALGAVQLWIHAMDAIGELQLK